MIKKGFKVKVLAGKDKKKEGEVIEIDRQNNRAKIKDINIIKNWLKTKENLTAIGRSGMFKYNNQDHAMATGLYAVRTLLGEGNFDPWSVTVDGEYHEEISSD